jgi:tetratricopeptide (TPR) repeat protein
VTARRLVVVLAAVSAFAGCGDPDLWARYRAERGFWAARRALERIEIQPRLASDRDVARVIAAFRAVSERFPAAMWADPARLDHPYRRDVALLSGRAAVTAARVGALHGGLEPAIADCRAIESDYAALPEVVLDARITRAAALERAGRPDEAIGVRAAIAREAPVIDREGRPVAEAIAAPLVVARALRERGRGDEADSVLRATEARDLDALRSLRGEGARALWDRVAETRIATGRTIAALAALREAAAASNGDDLDERVLRMATVAIDGGRADSGFVYARWAAAAFGPGVRARAMTLEAEAWERDARPDSALDAWERFLDAFPGTADLTSTARFRRGRLYESLGHWDQARAEYRALVAADPAHPRALEALRRIVAWHMAHGENDLARIEGRRGVESIDQLIATNRDDAVQQRARRARADLLLAIEDWGGGCLALSDLWNRYGDGGAGLRAADVAEQRLHDAERARRLYRDVAGHAGGAERRSALDALARLERTHGPGPS